MAELGALANSAGVIVQAEMIQRRLFIDSRTVLG